MVLAAVLWCVLGAVTMILQDHSTQQAVIALWYVPDPYIFNLLHSKPSFCILNLRHERERVTSSVLTFKPYRSYQEKLCLTEHIGMQGLGGQCDSGAPHGVTAVRAAEGHPGSQLCKLSSGDVCSGFADQLLMGYLRYGEAGCFCARTLQHAPATAACPRVI